MGKIIISVEKPLGEKNNKPLLIDEYVKVNIKGTMLNDICRIPRKSLREKDSVWVNIDGKLTIIPVDVIFKENETVLVKGLANPFTRTVSFSLKMTSTGIMVNFPSIFTQTESFSRNDFLGILHISLSIVPLIFTFTYSSINSGLLFFSPKGFSTDIIIFPILPFDSNAPDNLITFPL